MPTTTMSSSTSTSTTTTPTISKTITTAKDVLLYKPNLIGYGRVVCTILSLILMMYDINNTNTNTIFNNSSSSCSSSIHILIINLIQEKWVLAILLYILSFIGDLFDGIVARKYNETSTFGSVLDMITDRCSTAGLLFILACEYSTDHVSSTTTSTTSIIWIRILFVLLMILDISSHWVQMYSTLSSVIVSGKGNLGHHKSTEDNLQKNILVQWFYKYYWFFGYLCCGTEFTYILLYVQQKLNIIIIQQDQQQQSQQQIELILFVHKLVHWGICIGFPGLVAKQIVNIAQLCSSCYVIAQQDATIKNNKKST